jgi:hypothetical protein
MKSAKDKKDKRQNGRYAHRSQIVRESLITGTVVIGLMHNYSMGGFNFESNTLITLGDIIFIGLVDSPYSTTAHTYECHKVKIKWQKDVFRSRYRFAYGVQHLDPIGFFPEHSEQYYCDFPQYRNLISAVNKELRTKDLRKFDRKHMATAVYFTAENNIYRGLIRDVSRGGIFIESKNRLKVKQHIRIVIPGTKFDNGVMLKAQIIHQSAAGFGVRLLGILRV